MYATSTYRQSGPDINQESVGVEHVENLKKRFGARTSTDFFGLATVNQQRIDDKSHR